MFSQICHVCKSQMLQHIGNWVDWFCPCCYREPSVEKEEIGIETKIEETTTE